MTVADTFPETLRELCRNQSLAVLGTASGSAPYANPWLGQGADRRGANRRA